MKWVGLVFVFFAVMAFVIWRVRRASITGEKSRNRHFQRLANELNLQLVSDEYFIQLEGSYSNRRTIIYPHNFEGPGFVTLIYIESGVRAKDRSWVEPDLSLGRALVQFRRNERYDFEVSGENFKTTKIRQLMADHRDKYPYVAVTLPWRFSYSPLLQSSVSAWKHYAVFIAIDAGRHPSSQQLKQALDDGNTIAQAVDQSVIFSDTTE